MVFIFSNRVLGNQFMFSKWNIKKSNKRNQADQNNNNCSSIIHYCPKNVDTMTSTRLFNSPRDDLSCDNSTYSHKGDA